MSDETKDCLECAGSGVIREWDDEDDDEIPEGEECPNCGGTGEVEINFVECPTCYGHGQIDEEAF
ncbi:zinc finger domain-containing protein [Thiohalomonas denitrificans]|uniref:zinc finger domain-containing protein n=1 Tax=Thiohalomonas denitrificans TaxID=415747 RepID=UPI000B85EDFF|nr:zinc finger domain-containing protein [Thiohalomonas denitrificans]